MAVTYQCECGYKFKAETFPARCLCGRSYGTAGELKQVKRKERIRFGDKVEAELAKLGITEESYKAIKEKFGLPPGCNCQSRKNWLNKIDEWVRG